MTQQPRPGGAPSVLNPGDIVSGRYVVVRYIGEGGMGQVFEVEHEAIGRHFALKILNLNPCSEETLRRFHREARALGRVTSPRVAQVTDFGFEQNLGPFYIMELLEGETLEERLRREHHIPPHLAIPIAIDLCEALAEVHGAGIIHRDLKPSNVGLPSAGPMKVKLLDFGLAAAMDGAVLERITRSQEVVGSLPYLAPERFSSSELTLSVDLYALGVVLFESFTGRLPFEGNTAPMLINQHLNEQPMSFARAAPALQLPASLEAVVMRLLDKDPAQRFASASAAARALQAATIDAPMLTVLDESQTEAPTMFADDENAASQVPTWSSRTDHSASVAASTAASTSTPSTTPSAEPHGLPTSVIPGGAAQGTPVPSWPQPISAGEGDTSPSQIMNMPAPIPGQGGQGWVSGPIPPTSYQPTAAPNTRSRARSVGRIVAVVLAAIAGALLATLIGVLIFMGGDVEEPAQPPATVPVVPSTQPLIPPQGQPAGISTTPPSGYSTTPATVPTPPQPLPSVFGPLPTPTVDAGATTPSARRDSGVAPVPSSLADEVLPLLQPGKARPGPSRPTGPAQRPRRPPRRWQGGVIENPN